MDGHDDVHLTDICIGCHVLGKMAPCSACFGDFPAFCGCKHSNMQLGKGRPHILVKGNTQKAQLYACLWYLFSERSIEKI